MHGDKRIGLALGILLVGVVGAFFFRNEPAVLDEVPQLENPQQLDAQIAEKQITPYLTGVEEMPSPATRSLADADPVAPPPAAAEFDLLVDDQAFGNPFVGTKPAPEPIPMRPAPAVARDSIARFDHNQAWETISTATPAQPAAASTMPLHEVKRGDTLSGLAFQYLGSSARFQEIFAANRDLLKSPDDLRVGMKLRIPTTQTAGQNPAANFQRGTAAETTPSPRQPFTSNISIEQELDVFPLDGPVAPPPQAQPETPSRPSRLFEPVRRSPFLPRGSSMRSSQIEIPARPVRQLTQAPPDDLPPLVDPAAALPSDSRNR